MSFMNKLADGPPDVSILVTEPSPEAPNVDSTLVHVLVHRESEEYNTDAEDTTPTKANLFRKTPEIKISHGSEDICPVLDCPIVTIMVESPRDPPNSDFTTMEPQRQPPPLPPRQSREQAKAEDLQDPAINEPIDVNMPVDTTNIFYHYEGPSDGQDPEAQSWPISGQASEKDSPSSSWQSRSWVFILSLINNRTLHLLRCLRFLF